MRDYCFAHVVNRNGLDIEPLNLILNKLGMAWNRRFSGGQRDPGTYRGAVWF